MFDIQYLHSSVFPRKKPSEMIFCSFLIYWKMAVRTIKSGGGVNCAWPWNVTAKWTRRLEHGIRKTSGEFIFQDLVPGFSPEMKVLDDWFSRKFSKAVHGNNHGTISLSTLSYIRVHKLVKWLRKIEQYLTIKFFSQTRKTLYYTKKCCGPS